MAIQACRYCGAQILTEADPYVVLPKPSGTILICLKCQEEELAQTIFKKFDPWFTSGNSVKVERATILTKDYLDIKSKFIGDSDDM